MMRPMTGCCLKKTRMRNCIRPVFTKLMTALLVLERGNLNDTVTFSEDCDNQPGIRCRDIKSDGRGSGFGEGLSVRTSVKIGQ